jgi:hypothetical protein
VTPLTSAECFAIAERKMFEAMGDPRRGKELKLTAQAWMVLAEKVRQGEELQKQAEVLKTAKLAPDLASTAASSECLKQIADDIRAFHQPFPSRRKTEITFQPRHRVIRMPPAQPAHAPELRPTPTLADQQSRSAGRVSPA